jgi:hypothetical protein
MTGLREILLQSTQIAKLPVDMAKMPSLKLVRAKWSKLGPDGVKELRSAGIEVEL